MKRSSKYVALDVHQATTVTSVREEGGRVIARTVMLRLKALFRARGIKTPGTAVSRPAAEIHRLAEPLD